MQGISILLLSIVAITVLIRLAMLDYKVHLISEILESFYENDLIVSEEQMSKIKEILSENQNENSKDDETIV